MAVYPWTRVAHADTTANALSIPSNRPLQHRRNGQAKLLSKCGHPKSGQSSPQARLVQSMPGQAIPGQASPGKASLGQSSPVHAMSGHSKPGQSRQGLSSPGQPSASQARPAQSRVFEAPGLSRPGSGPSRRSLQLGRLDSGLSKLAESFRG